MLFNLQTIIVLMSLIIFLLSMLTMVMGFKIYVLKKDIKIRSELDDITHSSDVSEGYYDNVLQADLTNDKLLGKNCRSLTELLQLPEETPFSICIETILEKFIKDDYKQLYREQLNRQNLLDRYNNGIRKFSFEFEERSDLINYYWTRVTVCMYCSETTKSIRMLSYVKNIQAEKEKELQLFQQAHTDSLTGLLNKGACEKQISEILNNAQLNDVKRALLVIDVDKFKEINDRLGHVEGDKVLRNIARLLEGNLREADIIGRIGGDEFLVLINEYKTLLYLEGILKRLTKSVHQIEDLYKSKIRITISVGVSLFPEDADSFVDLFISADKALYKVKNNGRDNYSFFRRQL